MSDQIIESPALHLNGRGAVAYRGRLMFFSTARRLQEYGPILRRMAAKGMCKGEAARKMGWSVTTIVRWSKILGVPFPKKRNRKVLVHDKTGWREAIMQGVAKGMTQRQVACELDVPLVNVHRFCVDNGINWKNLKSHAKATRQRSVEG